MKINHTIKNWIIAISLAIFINLIPIIIIYMKKLLTILSLVLLAFTVNAQKATVSAFTATIVTNTYDNNTTEEEIETHIILDMSENAIKFIQNDIDWVETIHSIDTILESNSRIIQVWSETSYWEFRQYRIGQSKTWRPMIITEYPYFGQTDRRTYSRNTNKLNK